MSGSAGSQSAGSGGAGVVYTTVDAASTAKVPVALRFDGATKDFPLDPAGSGQYLGVHPIDQRVALAHLVRFGTIKSLPTFGSKFHQIPLNDRAEQAAIDEVNRIMKLEVDSGNVKVLAVVVERKLRVTGLLFVTTSYLNLRAADPNAVRSAANATFTSKS